MYHRWSLKLQDASFAKVNTLKTLANSFQEGSVFNKSKPVSQALTDSS